MSPVVATSEVSSPPNTNNQSKVVEGNKLFEGKLSVRKFDAYDRLFVPLSRELKLVHARQSWNNFDSSYMIDDS